MNNAQFLEYVLSQEKAHAYSLTGEEAKELLKTGRTTHTRTLSNIPFTFELELDKEHPMFPSITNADFIKGKIYFYVPVDFLIGK